MVLLGASIELMSSEKTIGMQVTIHKLEIKL